MKIRPGNKNKNDCNSRRIGRIPQIAVKSYTPCFEQVIGYMRHYFLKNATAIAPGPMWVPMVLPIG